METELEPEICAHEYCECSLKRGEGIVVGGEFYCCEECANGEGCSHEDCNCGEA